MFDVSGIVARKPHYVKIQWSPHDKLEDGTKCTLRKKCKVRHFVNAIIDQGRYLSTFFSAKIKEGIIVIPQVRSLMNDKKFEATMSVIECLHSKMLSILFLAILDILIVKILSQRC